MAYNLQPLITILEQILDPQQTCFIHDDSKPQLQSLLEKAISLQQILEKHSLLNIEISLEREIRDAAHKAEDIIESRLVDQLLSNSSLTEEVMIQQREYVTFFSPDLQQVMQELDSAMEQVVKLVKVEAGKQLISSRGSGSSSASASASAGASGSIHLVGFDEDLMELKDRLTGMPSKLEMIPIVGMGGAGKTTLARNLYEDPLVVSHFVARAWATVSQDYNMQTILLSLLSCITGKEVVVRGVSELEEILYKSLYGRRYMIVLDDIWSTKFWDEMRIFFPDNKNGSRVVITTRESNVARYANSESQQHEVQLLSESASWKLLRQIVFGEDYCPFELELIGEKMARGCGGLPLAITVIGGLLSKVERSRDVWENIGENVRGAIAKSEEGDRYSNIMSLSYKHLPNNLKPCFLYMGAFPEDYEIKGSKLIRLWIAEGFVKSIKDKSLEEEAEEYLKDLVDRNLLSVRRSKLNRKPKSYIIHDVLRDLCIRKADEDNFLHVMTNERGPGPGHGISKLRRVSIADRHFHDLYDSSLDLSLARSFVCNCWSHMIVRSICSVSNLLRVLDIMQVSFAEFPEEILQLVNLRYLGIDRKSLPVGISRLVNLQILITLGEGSTHVLSEIWKMSELRYLRLSLIIRIKDDVMEFVQMNKLHKVSRYLELTESLLERGFLEAIPNIKNLGVFWAGFSEIDLCHLHKLETLRFQSVFHKGCRFPPTLRKLTLSRCEINWRMMRSLCDLPNLVVLKIEQCCSFGEDGTDAEEWEAREGEEFRSLQFLQLESYKLMRWRADETNFPKLRHLLLQECDQLVEIPSGIGEIPTLELIEMKKCSASAVESANQILEVQQSEYDNYDIQLRIHDY